MTSNEPQPGSSPTRPLDGVRVLCINNYLAGNYGPMLLSLHGADVVKVEPPSGEASRTSKPIIPVNADGSEGWSHFELRMMRGVSSVMLDLSSAPDRKLFHDLVAATDVFWTNLRPDSALRRHVDWTALQVINPKLVYVSLTGFGLPENGVGEFSDSPAFDILVHGLTGLLARNADSEGTPQYNGLPIADQVTSTYAAFGAVLGLRQRDLTGTGCCVDVSMFDSMMAINEKALSMYGVRHEVPPPRASATTAPFGMFPASDGWVCIAVGSDGMWRDFCRAVGPLVGRPELSDDESLWSGTNRVARSVELNAMVEAFTRPRTAEEVVAHMNAYNVAAGQSLEVNELWNSRQVRSRGILRDIPFAAGPYPAVMSPIIISGSFQPIEEPHRLGEDRERVLREWLTTPGRDEP